MKFISNIYRYYYNMDCNINVNYNLLFIIYKTKFYNKCYKKLFNYTNIKKSMPYTYV